MSLFPLDQALRRLIRHGRIEVVDPEGQTHVFGRVGAGPWMKVRIADSKTKWALFLRPQATAGEAYTSGRMTIEEGTLRDFLQVALSIGIETGPLIGVQKGPPALGR